jgi:hypothetical protein
MMLAEESISSLPDSFWKNFCIALLVLLGAAGIAFGIWANVRKPEPVKLNDNPAIEVRKAPKRYNHDAIDQRFGQIETRLDGHDSELDTIWQEMQDKREKDFERHTEIAVSLAEIKGHLGIKSPKQS